MRSGEGIKGYVERWGVCEWVRRDCEKGRKENGGDVKSAKEDLKGVGRG